MVSFRLSAADYTTAEKSCYQHGIRSVSTLARNATLAFIHPGGSPIQTDSKVLNKLQLEVATLRTEVNEITRFLAGLNVGAANAKADKKKL